jgi:hypothetical protein
LIKEAFGTCPAGSPACPDPFNGPFGFGGTDSLQSQGGWNLPCFGPGCDFLGAGFTAERKEEIAEARDGVRSLAAGVRMAVSNQELQEKLAGPLDAGAAVLKAEPSPTQLDYGAQALQSFVVQIKAVPRWSLSQVTRSHLITKANLIRAHLTEPAPAEVVHTRHSRSQTM